MANERLRPNFVPEKNTVVKEVVTVTQQTPPVRPHMIDGEKAIKGIADNYWFQLFLKTIWPPLWKIIYEEVLTAIPDDQRKAAMDGFGNIAQNLKIITNPQFLQGLADQLKAASQQQTAPVAQNLTQLATRLDTLIQGMTAVGTKLDNLTKVTSDTNMSPEQLSAALRDSVKSGVIDAGGAPVTEGMGRMQLNMVGTFVPFQDSEDAV